MCRMWMFGVLFLVACGPGDEVFVAELEEAEREALCQEFKSVTRKCKYILTNEAGDPVVVEQFAETYRMNVATCVNTLANQCNDMTCQITAGEVRACVHTGSAICERMVLGEERTFSVDACLSSM